MVENSFIDDWDLDRKFLNLSAGMSKVFSWTYGMLGGRLIAPIDPNKFDNASSKIAEVGIRVLIVLGTIASLCAASTFILMGAVVLGGGAKVFRALGHYFQKDGFTHIHGKALEKRIEDGHARIMEWNIRGHGGGLHYAEGGVVHWSSRLDRIADAIIKEDPDVLVLQEIYDTSLIEAIVSKLDHSYAHFYTHLGANTIENESGMMVITKCAIHKFTHHDFTKTDAKARRGFATLEIKANPEESRPCLRVISTQLSPGKNASEMRMEQVAQIVDTLARTKIDLPTLFVGSLNVNRESVELDDYFYHSYLGDEPTHSGVLADQWAPIYDGQEESNDFISVFKRNPQCDCRTFPVLEKGIQLVDSHLVEGFEADRNTRNALSDHHAVVTQVSGLRL